MGRRKFQSKVGTTPTPAPKTKFEAVPVVIPINRTDRISRVGAAGVDARPEIVLSKTSLAGICLFAFACGIVTTVVVDGARPRVSDHEVTPRALDPTPKRATPEPPQFATAPAPRAPAPTASLAAAPVATAVLAVAPVPTAPVAAIHAGATPVKQVPVAPEPVGPIAGDPVVVRTPSPAAKSRAHSLVALRSPQSAASRAAAHQRPVAVASPPKKAKKLGPNGAPAGWVDPFAQ